MAAFGLALAVFALNLVLGGVATHYDAVHWASFIEHRAVLIPMLPCIVAGLFIGQFTVPVAVITWLLTFIIPGL